MKQVLNINLGGQTVTIHVDAYNYLCTQLDAIEKPIKNVEVAATTLANYEKHMVNLFSEQIKSQSIVKLTDIQNAIETLGSPEIPISALYRDENEVKGARATSTKRKLFRDADNKIIGGVASGIAAYFGIYDPIWVRIGFVGLMVAGFASVPIYFLLWIAMPLASTRVDQNSMHGEPVDISNVADTVAHQLDNLSTVVRRKFGRKTSF